MKVNNLALTERPMKFDDVIGQGVIVKNLAAQSKTNKFFQSYLMYGHYGCGKTTTARILAAAINCHHKDENGNPCGTCEHCQAVRRGCADMVEIDGASNTGIDNIRQLKEQVEYLPTVLDKKVYIIDEVHKLSDAAFNALLKVLEEPPAHVVFILATTDMDKIPATVLSRLAKYEFKRISTDTLVEHLKTVAEKNGYTYTTEGLSTIARNSDGSVRNAIKMLEIVSELTGGVTEENAGAMIGLLDPEKVYDLLDLLLGASTLNAFQLATTLMADGWDPKRLTAEMVRICSDAVLASERLDLVDGSDTYKGVLKRICGTYSVDRVIVVLDFLMELTIAMRESAGDRDVFRNRILLYKYNANNQIWQLEEDVCQLKAKLERLESGYVHAELDGASETINYQASQHDFEHLDEDDNPPWSEGETDSLGEQGQNADTEAEPEDETVTGDAQEAEKEPEAKAEVTEPKVVIDPFAMFAGRFQFAQKLAPVPDKTATEPVKEAPALRAELDSEKKSEAVTRKEAKEVQDPGVDADYLAPETTGSVEEFMERVENEQPVLDNLIEMGFTKLQEGETTVFETDEPAFFNIGKAFAGAMGGFPIGLRKAK